MFRETNPLICGSIVLENSCPVAEIIENRKKQASNVFFNMSLFFSLNYIW